MATKRQNPEEFVTKFRQVEVLVGQGMARVCSTGRAWEPRILIEVWRGYDKCLTSTQMGQFTIV